MERKQLFRLCHVCDCLNESEEEILKCVKCAKSFLPINYFEKLRERAIKVANESESESKNKPQIAFNPLQGLIVFW